MTQKATRHVLMGLVSLSVFFGSCKKDIGIDYISIYNGKTKDVPNFYFPWYAYGYIRILP